MSSRRYESVILTIVDNRGERRQMEAIDEHLRPHDVVARIAAFLATITDAKEWLEEEAKVGESK